MVPLVKVCVCNSSKESNIYMNSDTDINECDMSMHNCAGIGGECVNTDGSYECTCLPGFIGNGTVCEGRVKCFGNYMSEEKKCNDLIILFLVSRL